MVDLLFSAIMHTFLLFVFSLMFQEQRNAHTNFLYLEIIGINHED